MLKHKMLTKNFNKKISLLRLIRVRQTEFFAPNNIKIRILHRNILQLLAAERDKKL